MMAAIICAEPDHRGRRNHACVRTNPARLGLPTLRSTQGQSLYQIRSAIIAAGRENRPQHLQAVDHS